MKRVGGDVENWNDWSKGRAFIYTETLGREYILFIIVSLIHGGVGYVVQDLNQAKWKDVLEHNGQILKMPNL